jgi:phage/plasmid-associated DNA primase
MLVAHLRFLQQEGFKDEDTPYLVACKSRFAESNNPVIGFVQSAIDPVQGCRTDTIKVYERYVKYCARRGYKPKSEQHFGKELRSVLPNIERIRESSGARRYVYEGIDLDSTTE